MKIKTAELTGAALNIAVCLVLGWTLYERDNHGWLLNHEESAWEVPVSQLADHDLDFSENWSQGGPIIEREKILLMANCRKSGDEPWVFESWFADRFEDRDSDDTGCDGPTPLIAAMRCFVASKLGDEVEIPEELMS